jgi:hypothetical protein
MTSAILSSSTDAADPRACSAWRGLGA